MATTKLLVEFSSTDVSESGFSKLAYRKSKYRALLDVESDPRCACRSYNQKFKNLSRANRANPSKQHNGLIVPTKQLIYWYNIFNLRNPDLDEAVCCHEDNVNWWRRSIGRGAISYGTSRAHRALGGHGVLPGRVAEYLEDQVAWTNSGLMKRWSHVVSRTTSIIATDEEKKINLWKSFMSV